MATSRKRGFTLVELIVVNTTAAVLLTATTPALIHARENARRIVCQTNLSGLGRAFLMYASDNREYIPPLAYSPDRGAETGDTWATLLDKEGYVSAPWAESRKDLPTESTLFKCPSGRMELWNGAIPESQTDPLGATAMAQQRSDEDWDWSDDNSFIHVWYGANAATYTTDRFPMVRVPNDGGDWDVLHRLSEIEYVAETVALFDGVWAHNCGTTSPEGANRINARHAYGTQTNVLILAGHAESIDLEQLPTGGPLHWSNTYLPHQSYPKWAINPTVP